MTTLKRGNANLLRLADYVERRQRARPRRRYDQRMYEHACGAPACLIGHGVALGQLDYWLAREGARLVYAVTSSEDRELFSQEGCNNAGTDWRKAVAYVREFVKRRGGV
jgi:hypothetical protein